MSSRRRFLKTTLAVTAGLVLEGSKVIAGSGPFPTGVVYTEEDPGMWSEKVKSHAPQVTISGGQITIETKHGMSKDHYIVRHTLVTNDGKVVGFKVFTPEDKPVSSYEVSGKGQYYATSFCNLHDFWVTQFNV